MIRFHMLGALELRAADSSEIRSVVAQPKRTALLAYLAAASPQGFHRRDTLLGLFWPESDQLRGRDSLRQAVRFLRRSLGEGVLVGRGDEEVAIDPARLWCDAAAFRAAIAANDFSHAIDLYRGDFLSGFFVSGAPELERWIETERASLRNEAVRALWALAERLESAGDAPGAVARARQAAKLGPDDEPTVRRLIALFDRLDDRASAVRTYQEFAARLAREYGEEPSVITRAALDALMSRTGPGSWKAMRSDPMAGADAWMDEPTPAQPRTADLRVPTSAPSSPGLAALGKLSSLGPRFAIAAALATLLGAAGLALRTDRARPGFPQVVVAPFENRTGDPSLDALGYWAADWVAHGLARTELQVVNAAVGLPGSTPTGPREIQLRMVRERARTSAAVTGAYYRHGDSIQFQVQVTDARNGAVLAGLEPTGATVEHPQRAVRALSERVTGVVAAYLDPSVRALNSYGSQPPSYEAYRVWADGLRKFGRHDYIEARERLLHAASIDSGFVTPLIWAAATYANSGDYATADSLLGIVNGKRNQLVPFDLHLLDYWRSSLRGNLAGRYEAARAMLAVAPASEIALYLFGGSAIAINHPDEAVAALREVDVERSAIDWDSYGLRLNTAYHLLGDHRQELEAARRAWLRRPELLRTALDEVRALAALGRTEEVFRLLDRSAALPPQPRTTFADIAQTAAEELRAHGHGAAADIALVRAIEWYRSRPAAERASEAHRYALARALYRAGRSDEALALFETLAAEAPHNVNYRGYLGALAARMGNARQASRIADDLAGVNGPYFPSSGTYWRARIAAVAGRRDDAVALLRTAFAQGEPHGLSIHTESDFDSLRDDPEFRRLVAPRRRSQ